MSLLDKFAEAAAKRDKLMELGTNPTQVRMERMLDATTAMVNGKPVILAGTNNYLGLTFDEDCRAAAKKAVDDHGTGTTGSRVANGTYAEHTDLEAALAAHLNMHPVSFLRRVIRPIWPRFLVLPEIRTSSLWMPMLMLVSLTGHA